MNTLSLNMRLLLLATTAHALLHMSAADLATTTLRPVKNGAINGNSIEASSLWRDNGALVFVVRRPG